MKSQLQPDLPANARAAVAHLWKAFAYARDMGLDRWEFALPLLRLVELGVDESDLRWLVLNGYVDHADERTTFRDRTRRFRPSANVAFTSETCFVLSEAGALVAGSGSEETDSQPSRSSNSPPVVLFCSHLPRWDRKLRVLFFDGCVVKRFRLPAKNQEAVLSAFEQESWPPSIDDPLPFVPKQRPKKRLHATIRCLNANQENRLIRFRGNGTGQAVLWEPIVGLATDHPTV